MGATRSLSPRPCAHAPSSRFTNPLRVMTKLLKQLGGRVTNPLQGLRNRIPLLEPVFRPGLSRFQHSTELLGKRFDPIFGPLLLLLRHLASRRIVMQRIT